VKDKGWALHERRRRASGGRRVPRVVNSEVVRVQAGKSAELRGKVVIYRTIMTLVRENAAFSKPGLNTVT